jgi:hypothetical protein
MQTCRRRLGCASTQERRKPGAEARLGTHERRYMSEPPLEVVEVERVTVGQHHAHGDGVSGPQRRPGICGPFTSQRGKKVVAQMWVPEQHLVSTLATEDHAIAIPPDSLTEQILGWQVRVDRCPFGEVHGPRQRLDQVAA